ncbi:MAG: hypothetical protein WC333_00165 [Dehalococcoidia bacterium]|jgi:hypothetical protein
MARIDYEAVARNKAEEAAFTKLMKFLAGEVEVNFSQEELYHARGRIIGMTIKIKQMEEKIEKYQEFFNTLHEFLPKPMTVHDRIY